MLVGLVTIESCGQPDRRNDRGTFGAPMINQQVNSNIKLKEKETMEMQKDGMALLKDCTKMESIDFDSDAKLSSKDAQEICMDLDTIGFNSDSSIQSEPRQI